MEHNTGGKDMKSFSRVICLVVGMSFILNTAGISTAVAGMNMAPEKGAGSESGCDQKMDLSAQAKAEAMYAKRTLCFEANQGQTDASVKFVARGEGYTLFLTAAEAVLAVGAAKDQERDVVRMSLEGAETDPLVQGVDTLPSYSNYMTGNSQRKWHTNVKQYSKVEYKQVYPGIDLVYYGNEQQLEYDFVVAPGANPGLIRMDFQGAKSLELDQQGNLVLNLSKGQMTFNAPILYQKTGNTRESVAGQFVLSGNEQVGFKVAAYDTSKELVIDPSLVYSTYLGTTVVDRVNAMAVDLAGNVYLTGQTQTVADKFPGTTLPGMYQASNNGGAFDAFAIKLNPAGDIVWATYYGGVADDIGLSIGVDGVGKAYISGSTTGTLPTPFQLLGTGGGTDAFIAVFSADGTALVYARQFGSPQVDSADGIAVDAAGNAYLTGFTGSTADNSFPITFAGGAMYASGSAQTSFGGAGDAFVSKFNPAGVLQYSTYLGGTGIDRGNAIAVDSLGAAYIAGNCGDAFVAAATYPIVFKNTANNIVDGFFAKLDPTGATFTYKTYVGGANSDAATAIAVTVPDVVFITGWTDSGDFPDTTIAAPNPKVVGQLTNAGAPDAFVLKLHLFQPGGGQNDCVYSTYLGGNGIDRATAIKVDADGDAYVTGTTESPDFVSVGPGTQPSLPYTAAALGGTSDAFVAVISPDGLNPRLFNTYLGGVTLESGTGIGLDGKNNIYVAGWTTSAGVYPTGFPTVIPLYPANAGATDGFVMKFAPVSIVPLPSVTSVSPSGGLIAGGTTVVITGTLFSDVSGVTGVTFGGVNATSYLVNSSTQITAISPPHTAGIVDIVVTSPAGSSPIVPEDTYTYFIAGGVPPVITGIDPILGPVTGGTQVVITGTGFTGINTPNGVKFGATNATSYTVDSDTQITAIAPAHVVAIVDVVVTSLEGSSAIVPEDQYTYFLTPGNVPGATTTVYFDPYIFPSPTKGNKAGIAYYMLGSGVAKIRVYNEIGNLVISLDESKRSGPQASTISVSNLAPGVYIYLLSVNYDDGSKRQYPKRKFAVTH